MGKMKMTTFRCDSCGHRREISKDITPLIVICGSCQVMMVEEEKRRKKGGRTKKEI